MSDLRWLVVVDPTGTVIGISGSAPDAWYGKPIEDIRRDFLSISDAAREVIAAVALGATAPSTKITLDRAAERIEVVVVALAAVAIVRSRVDLRVLVDRAVAPFRAQAADRDVVIVVESGDAPIVVSADEAKIVWIVATLVGNALRFARAGTRRLPGGTIQILVLAEDGRAVIEVEDDGPGMSPERVRGLFERQGGENPGGVALRMARDVAQAHGGRLDVESSAKPEEHFTCVRVTLPHR